MSFGNLLFSSEALWTGLDLMPIRVSLRLATAHLGLDCAEAVGSSIQGQVLDLGLASRDPAQPANQICRVGSHDEV